MSMARVEETALAASAGHPNGETVASHIKTIGVLGAGQMGNGIAQVAAASGFDVVLVDATSQLADRGKQAIAARLTKQVEKGKLTAEARTTQLARVEPAASADDFGTCDFVIEAAKEDTDLKIALFRQCDAALAPGKWLASNTSSISLTKLAAATSRPDRVVGIHFMNPAPVMQLVEIVRAAQTSDETYALAVALATRMGKTTTTSRDAPGFLVNRILIPMTPEDIDTGARLGLNHPMGPLELSDLIGLDTVLAIADVLHREIGDDKYRAPTLLRRLVAAGWLGRKTGRGFYVYDERGNRVGG
jgi:3-hydroxybutyryl-CoA dehydrogenase